MTEIQIHRAPLPADQYMIVTNDFMRGKLPVPLKALPRVLLGYFLSLPTGWRATREQVDEAVLEGRDAVDKALRDLESTGYLRRARRRGQGGTWLWTYAITDDPKARPLQASPSPESQGMEPTSENSAKHQVAPSPGNPGPENQGIRTEDCSQKTEQKTADALASVPALPLPEVDDELAKRRAEQPKPPTLNQLANRLAAVHYEAVDKMGNFMGFREVMAKALRAGYHPAQITDAAAALRERNVTLGAAALRSQLEGGPRRNPTTTGPNETRLPSGHILEYR
jgi:hypothetical protein